MIGICSRYRKQDATLAALSVMRYADAVGRKCSFLGVDWRASTVDPLYDNRVVSPPFGSWLRDKRCLVWTGLAPAAAIVLAHRNSTANVTYIGWDVMDKDDGNTLKNYGYVLMPSESQAARAKEMYSLTNLAVVPYYPFVPITRKQMPVSPGRVRLFVSIYGQQLRRLDVQTIMLLPTYCKDYPHVEVTVACSKGLSPRLAHYLAKLNKQFPERWRYLKNCDWHTQTALMAQHDVTIWPAKYDSYGIVGLSSLYAGTPVISWDMLPFSEYLQKGVNSLLVPCEAEYDWLGMPVAIPNHDGLDETIRFAIETPEVLARLRIGTALGLHERQQAFFRAWTTVFPPA